MAQVYCTVLEGKPLGPSVILRNGVKQETGGGGAEMFPSTTPSIRALTYLPIVAILPFAITHVGLGVVSRHPVLSYKVCHDIVPGPSATTTCRAAFRLAPCALGAPLCQREFFINDRQTRIHCIPTAAVNAWICRLRAIGVALPRSR